MRGAAATLAGLALLLLGAGAASAQGGGGTAAAMPPAACSAPEPLSGSAYGVSLALDPSTGWQPRGGEIRFTLKAAVMPAPGLQLHACFRWHGENGEYVWLPAPPPRVIDTSVPNQVTYGVLVPQELQTNASASGAHPLVQYTGLWLIPQADMHVWATATGAWTRFDAVEQVGVSNKVAAFALALAVVLIAWFAFLCWGQSRGVKGDPILAVISTRFGVASLSQLQIMIWTFVIGAGAIYVMALSGSLIDIPQSALGLLGITGLATLGAKLNASNDGGAKAPNAPGATTGLALSGAASATSLTLTWTPPAGADATLAYMVQMRLAGVQTWSTVASSLAAPPFAVRGLTASTTYDFQVFAVNGAGSGPPAVLFGQATAAAGPAPAGAPGQVGDLRALPGERPESMARLTWTPPVPAPDAHVVQFRKAGTPAWSTASGSAASPWTVTGLDGSTDYEFQVFAVNAGLAGQPSPIAALRTAVRMPRWSDLVVAGDGGSEIDVTRVQMLLFTIVAAAFVALRLFSESMIPEIPSGILTLVGLSNGVYLGAKFVPGPR